jgi:hypothetical protein
MVGNSRCMLHWFEVSLRCLLFAVRCSIAVLVEVCAVLTDFCNSHIDLANSLFDIPGEAALTVGERPWKSMLDAIKLSWRHVCSMITVLLYFKGGIY